MSESIAPSRARATVRAFSSKRDSPAASVDPTVKNYHWLDMVKGLYSAYDKGAETAILLDTNGNVAEGPGFNVFTVRNGIISTPQLGVLLGITRQTIFDISEHMNVECLARNISADDLKAADEVFVTSTAGGVMPVTKIDNSPIGNGFIGPLTKRITESYWQMHEDDQYRVAISYP